MAEPSSRPTSGGGCSVDDLNSRRAELEELRQRVMNVVGHATGLGVGLPVARRLAEHARGTLHLEAGPDGNGVTAVLEVPAP